MLRTAVEAVSFLLEMAKIYPRDSLLQLARHFLLHFVSSHRQIPCMPSFKLSTSNRPESLLLPQLHHQQLPLWQSPPNAPVLYRFFSAWLFTSFTTTLDPDVYSPGHARSFHNFNIRAYHELFPVGALLKFS